MPPVASTTARDAHDHRPCRRVAGLAQLQAGDGVVLGQQRFGDKTFDHADRGRVAHGVDQRRHDRLAGHVAAHMHDAPRRMRGLAGDREPAFEVAVERHAVAQAGRGCAQAPRAPVRARCPRRPGRRRPRWCRRRGPPRCRLRHRRRDAALRPGLEAPSPSGAAEITVTGRGASFSAQNSPARPPPTMTTSSVCVRSVILTLHVCLSSSSRPSRANALQAGTTVLQLFRLIIRSTERRALSAISGSTVTSSRR